MQESYAARQPESDRTRNGLAQKPLGAQEPLQRAIDPGRYSFYVRLLGHRPPPGLDLFPSPQRSDEQPVQQQMTEDVQRESISVEERYPLQRREALRAQLWGDQVPSHLRLSPSPQIQQKPVEPFQRKENTTGLSDPLKAGVEDLSGLSLDDVQVHYNSSQPAEVQALAYTRGTEIYVGPGQEEHLAHEVWHVVQQKQGRVQPSLQAKGVTINDDAGLEREADEMGVRISQVKTTEDFNFRDAHSKQLITNVIQLMVPRNKIKNTNGKTVVKQLLYNLLRAHGLEKEAKDVWQDQAFVPTIAEVAENFEKADTSKKEVTDEIKRALIIHDDIKLLLLGHRITLEMSGKGPAQVTQSTNDPNRLAKTKSVYEAFQALLFFHASPKANEVRGTGLKPDKGGNPEGYATVRSPLDKKITNVNEAEGKVYVTRKHSEAMQYAKKEQNKEGSIVMLIIPISSQAELQIDPDSQFGLLGIEHLQGAILDTMYPNDMGKLYLMDALGGNVVADGEFDELWGELVKNGLIHP